MVSKTKLDLVEESFSQVKVKLPEYLAEHGIECNDHKKFKCINPEHNDKSPSMSLFQHDAGFPIARCHSCGFIADIFTAAHILEERPIIGPGFLHENVKYLADKYGIEVKIGVLSEEDIYEINTYEAYKATSDFINKTKYNTKCLNEVEYRKWNEDFLKEYLVSCCVDYHEMRQHLKNIGFSARFLDDTDLDNQKIFNQDNLIFTICDEYGRPVGFSARNLNFDPAKDKQTQSPKFTNTKTTGLRCNIFRKSERLYMIHVAKKFVSSANPLYIVEGYGDTLTLHMNGVKNAAGVSSADLNEKQLNLCRKLGINDIIICLDGDDVGQTKAKQILDEVLTTVHDLRIRFVFLPWDGTNKVDPDQFIRDNGIVAFLALEKVEPFTWRLSEFIKDIEDKNGKVIDSDLQLICQTMIPIVAAEPSPIRRESMIKELSNHTAYSFQVIKEELDKILNAEAVKIQRKQRSIIDNLVSSLQARKDGYEISIERALNDLDLVAKESQSDKFDSESLVSVIQNIKSYQESEDQHRVIDFGPNLRTLPIALAGDIRQKLVLLGGGANAGKTALFSNMSYNLAQYNEDVVSIVLTIDDGSRDFLSRMVAYLMAKTFRERNQNDLFEAITIGKVAQPFTYKHLPEYEILMQEREFAYRQVIDLVSAGKLGIFDSSYGKSVSLLRSIVKKTKNKLPHHKIFVFVDNFHLLDSSSDVEGREKYKQLSHDIKDLAVANDLTVCSTVEYTKLPTGQKPGNNNIAETVALDYDSNATMHLYNELHDLRDKSKLYFTDGNGEKCPVIEHYFGKNKISSFKSSIYYKFYANKSYYEEINLDEMQEIKSMNSIEFNLADGATQKTRVSLFTKPD
jgi:DNA primase catalytic core